MSNTKLHKAKQIKNDEFYTLYEDIEAELSHYSIENFKDKIIYCPCDTPDSNFVKYFENNKDKLKYRELIHTSIQEGFDFRSDYCEGLFDRADIVVTNPPFSLFREFIYDLEKHNLKYIVWGGRANVSYKYIFSLIKDNRLWLGKTIGTHEKYITPDGTIKEVGTGIYTNIDYPERHNDLVLYCKYVGNEDKYPKYDNYNIIEVSKTNEIPLDYEGEMGVPITFLYKYNPEQFELLYLLKPIIDGKNLFRRVVIKRR